MHSRHWENRYSRKVGWKTARFVDWTTRDSLNCQGSKNCDAVDVGPMSYRTSIANWIDQRDVSNARYLRTLTNSIDASCPEKLQIPPYLSRGSSGGKVLSENRWDDGSGILTRIRNGEEFSQGISRLPISIPLSAQPTKSRPRSSSRGQSTGYFLG